ncbi:hypothetical protein EOL94_01030 [bacterium]|nr:hypothetical protein [bacterium]
MKKTTKIILSLLVFFIAIPFGVKAVNIKNSENIIINENQIVAGNFYVTASNLEIKGVINGDLIAISQNINVSGKILGDIISISEKLKVEGEVEGNIRSLSSEEIYINNYVGKNITVLTKNLKLGPNAEIIWDALIGSLNTEIKGKINGNIDTFTEKLFLSGIVKKDLNIFLPNKKNSNQIQISNEAQVLGNLNYTNSEKIEVNSEKISGEIVFNKKNKEKNTASFIWKIILSIFSALVVGLVLINIFKSAINKFNGRLTKNIEKKLLPGFLFLILTPVASFVLILTIIGIPLAVIVLCLWIILIYLTKIFAGISLGYVLKKKIFKCKDKNLMKDLIIGVPLLFLSFKIPFIGPIISLLTIIIVLGNIWINRKCLLKK